jgi:hypothetical protein
MHALDHNSLHIQVQERQAQIVADIAANRRADEARRGRHAALDRSGRPSRLTWLLVGLLRATAVVRG